jgi:hypothetical protein
VDALAVSVLKAAGVVGGFALFVYLLYRGVVGAKKAGRTGSVGEVVGILLMIFGAVIVPSPPREVPVETRKQGGDEDESGDPENDAATELTEPTGRKTK